jgi:hypothetical protein
MQITAFDLGPRKKKTPPGQPLATDVGLGLLPQSHIYSLVSHLSFSNHKNAPPYANRVPIPKVVMCHAGPYRGDQTVVLPKYELNMYLDT